MVDDFGSAADNVKKLAEEIVGRCVGLPLQILHFGYLMSGKDANDPKLLEWLQHIYPDLKQWLAYLKIGRSNFLEDWLLSKGIYFEDWHENLRKIYAFFNLFLRDYEIPTRRLVALSAAEELEEEGRDKNKSPKPVAMYYLSILIGLNLIRAVEMNINWKVTKCRLPNALRDQKFFQSTISGENLAISQKNKIKDEQLADHCDRSSNSFNDIHCQGINSPNFQKRYKYLVSYLSFDTGEGYKPEEDIKNFLQKGIANGCFRSLKVLDLEHVYIQTSIAQHRTISSIDVFRLKMDLPGGNPIIRRQLTGPPNSGCEAYLLFDMIYVDWIVKKENLQNGLNKLKKLTKLGLAFRLESPEQKNALVKWVKGLIYLKSLRLRSVGEKGEALDLYLENISELNNLSSLYLFGKLEDQSIKSLFPNTDYFCLSDLTLSASGLKEDPMPTLGSLPKLKSLSFHLGSFKGKEMVCLGKGFPELLVLKLGKLESLEEFQVEEGAMQKLRELDIRCCNKLKVPTGLKHLKSLQELKLTNMPENFTTTIEKKKWQIWDDTAHPPRITKDHLSGK
ncbi:inactive disease susceptibility protein LOV1-like [Quercus suber]|uniref:inactive disease susceptibility protein LOV1-like n=1 Tax=Quercus suber TaxID=58331 RepID=UPI0032DE6CED